MHGRIGFGVKTNSVSSNLKQNSQTVYILSTIQGSLVVERSRNDFLSTAPFDYAQGAILLS